MIKNGFLTYPYGFYFEETGNSPPKFLTSAKIQSFYRFGPFFVTDLRGIEDFFPPLGFQSGIIIVR